jgi:hypothetical protein
MPLSLLFLVVDNKMWPSANSKHEKPRAKIIAFVWHSCSKSINGTWRLLGEEASGCVVLNSDGMAAEFLSVLTHSPLHLF